MLSKTTWPPQSVGDEEGVRTLLASVWMWNKPKVSHGCSSVGACNGSLSIATQPGHHDHEVSGHLSLTAGR